MLCALFVVVTHSLAAGVSGGGALVVDATNSPFVVATETTVDSLTVSVGGTLVVNAPLTVDGAANVQSGGVVTHDVRDEDFALTVNGTLTISAGGTIDVTGKGLKAGGAGSAFGATGETLDPLTLVVEAGAPSGV